MNKFDLIEKTGEIGMSAISLCKSIRPSAITSPLISQIVRSATSIGANYCEATECNSKKDFINKITIAKKEAKETLHWIKMIKHAEPRLASELEIIADKTQQLVLIFSATIKTSQEKNIAK